jgi:CubicO group peptidase (beta-lactamase class C family)
MRSADGRAVHGGAGAAFAPVVDAFAANFRERGEVGAALCVYQAGVPVVDIWAGVADARTGRAWTATTPAIVFSCTKGVLAIAAYRLVQDGRLDLEAPVVDYWPEFGQAGKANVRARDLLSHRAGLSALDRSFTRAEVLGWEPVIRAIEVQAPLWPPGTGHLYHTMTYGWLIGELIRRISGESVGAFIRQRLAEPLGLRIWVGLPSEEQEHVAWLLPPLPDADLESAREIRAADAEPERVRAATTGGAFAFPADGEHVTFNDPDIQAAEVPGANGIADARSLARLYAACVQPVDGLRLMTQASVEDALVERSAGAPMLGGVDRGSRWGTGFALASPPDSPLLGPRSFGHGGAGGELAFGDDDHGIGFGYVNNQMGGIPDERAGTLVAALRRCLDG